MSMIFQHTQFSGPALDLLAGAQEAIAQIPPAFPLTATVAVNPFLGQARDPRPTAAARLARAGGIRIAEPRETLAARLADGRLTEADLSAAASATGLPLHALKEALSTPTARDLPLPTMAGLAQAASGIDWPEFIADRIGLWAAAHFDEGQALWPPLQGGAFLSWRRFASRDLTSVIAGLPGFAAHVAMLPRDHRAALVVAADRIGLTPEAAPAYFHRLLMTLGGWAQVARARGWLAERDGGQDDSLLALLTIRLVWEAALWDQFGAQIAPGWQAALASYRCPPVASVAQRIDLALQDAAERGEERRLAALFDAPAPAPDGGRPAIQAAFCIDVRSEVYRRALEQADEGIATIGFAGFFGLPLSHRRAGSDSVEARAPVLLKPALDTAARPADDCDRRIRARATRAWGRFKMAAVSAFAFVEAAGPLYAAKLVGDSRARPRRARLDPAPTLDLPLAERIAAARTVLGAMSLTQGFARLVLLAGHGAEVTNAPHASALQCGACGGHAGDVNARALAGLLNDGEVRAGLAEAGIVIPEDTLFVASLHDTVSDEMTLFDDAPAPGHGPDLDRLRGALARAGRLARTERALSLPRAGGEASLAARGGDWSDLRPEWGLAGCSAFIAAPRHRSRGRDLAGRAFLHSYDWQADEGFATLELILTAPVVVASWISLQYYGSTVAPEAFGAGNKLLHNVTGGIGVVEGNGGLLRAGLPMQSVHDGSAFRHEALRLSVVIEAPTEAISGVLEKHPELAALFDNGWLSLSAMDAAGRIAWRYEAGGWQASGAGAAAVQAA